MFIYTTKLTKKKRAIGLVVLLVIAAGIALLAFRGCDGGEENTAASVQARSNKQRVAYLESYGWVVEEEPVETQSVIIPRSFEGAYEEYLELQTSQGFELTPYAGTEVTRYTYHVLNHPCGSEAVYADLLVYRNKVIAGDVQSVELEGFMHGLAFPETEG